MPKTPPATPPNFASLPRADAAPAETAIPTALDGTTWQVIRLRGTPVGMTPPTLGFDAGKVTGTGGCNPYSTAVAGAMQGLRMGPAISGKRACSQPVMAQEQQYFDLLIQVRRADIGADGTTLVLRDDGGRVVIEAVRT